MKKLFTLIATALLSTAAMAENVGTQDCNTGWWTAFSGLQVVETNKTLHMEYTNYTSGTDIWNNWALVITNGKALGADGYSEYAVLRTDSYGWGSAYANGVLTLDRSEAIAGYDEAATQADKDALWNSTFKSEMQGAKVVMDFVRSGNALNITWVMTATNGIVWTKTYKAEDFTYGANPLGVFFTVDHSYMEIDDNATAITDTPNAAEPANVTVVGAKNCTTTWWGAHSDLNTIEANKTLHMEFENYTSGVNNYNNWVLVISNGQYLAGGDTEYLVLRSDNYGWASKYALGTVAHYRVNPIPGFDELTDQDAKDNLYWSTFRTEMQGAKVVLEVARWENQLTITATATATNGEQWIETFTAADFVEPTQDLGAWLTVDGCYLVIDNTATTITNSTAPTAISTVKAVKGETGVRYNLAGQKVGNGFKGVVIENGKKLVVK